MSTEQRVDGCYGKSNCDPPLISQRHKPMLTILSLLHSFLVRAASCLITNDCLDVEEEEEEEIFTTGRDVGEALVLAPFPLAVADVEVHVDRSGEPLVPIGRDLHEE